MTGSAISRPVISSLRRLGSGPWPTRRNVSSSDGASAWIRSAIRSSGRYDRCVNAASTPSTRTTGALTLAGEAGRLPPYMRRPPFASTVSRMTYEPTGVSVGGRHARAWCPGRSVASVVQRTSLRLIPIRTASRRTRARRSRSNTTRATSRPGTPGATVTNSGLSPAKRLAAPRTARAPTVGGDARFATARLGTTPSALSPPRAARSSRRRESASSTLAS